MRPWGAVRARRRRDQARPGQALNPGESITVPEIGIKRPYWQIQSSQLLITDGSSDPPTESAELHMTNQLGPRGIDAQGVPGFRHHKSVRLVLTLTLWITCVALPTYLGAHIDDLFHWESTIAQDTAALSIQLLTPMLLLFLALPKVSYRRRDCLIFLIPVYGSFVFSFIIIWRLVYLPLRDWPPRPDERSA